MREFAKSVFSYTASTSLFGAQQMLNLFTPQGWRQTDRAAESFKKITEVTNSHLSETAKGTFKVADDMQRRGVDMMFGVFTLGAFDRGKDSAPGSESPTSHAAAGTVSNLGEQAVAAFTQGLQAASQTATAFMQSMSGVVSNTGCGGSQSQSTGWGPVPPPPRS